jgi:hypothetical protein
MATGSGNFVVLLIDESSAMSAVMRDKLADGTESTKTNAERVATSVNNLLKHLSVGPACDVAVVGYRSDADGQPAVGSRWTGGLAGRDFVSSDELASAARVETRTKKVPRSDGSIAEEPLSFSVWYEPVLGAKAPQIAAFRYCRELVEKRAAAGGGQGILVHVFAGSSGDGSPQKAVEELLHAAGAPVVVQCHLAASAALVTTSFPSKQAYLASALARDLFVRASELPDHLRDCLRAAKVQLQSGARAIVHNAKMSDLFRCLQLARQHVTVGAAAPPPAPVPAPVTPTTAVPGGEAAPPTPAAVSSPGCSDAREGLVVFVLDRSVEDPFAGNMANPCSRLQEAANDLLKQISTKDLASRPIDAAIVSYGLGGDGQPEVRSTFDGPLAGRSIVRNADLPAGAIRVEEEETQVSNGVGGLITVKKKTPIYFDVEPAAAAPPQPAFEAAAAIIRDWCGQHPSGASPILLHLTRGTHDPSNVDACAAIVSSLGTAVGPLLLHHLVITEVPHPSLSYPESDGEIQGDSLRALWHVSSQLPDWEKLQAAKRPHVTAWSRGFVVNGKYDILGDELVNAVTGDVVAVS